MLISLNVCPVILTDIRVNIGWELFCYGLMVAGRTVNGALGQSASQDWQNSISR